MHFSLLTELKALFSLFICCEWYSIMLILEREARSCLAGVGFMNICEIRPGMENVNIKGNIVDKNSFMMLIRDKTGQIFFRYRKKFMPRVKWQKLRYDLEIGNKVKITNCDAVNWQGILQLKLADQGNVALIS